VARSGTVVLALGALPVLGGAPLSCAAEPPTIYCVFENGALAGGRCLTECESRCNLETIAGCAPPTCVDDCDRAASHRTDACLDASYAYWRCLRTSGQPEVTCEADVPVFSVNEDTCRSQRDTMQELCPDADAGAPDAGP